MSDDYISDAHRAITEFAQAFLEEDEREDFIDSMMERTGHVRESRWAPPESQQQQGQRAPLLKQRGQGGGQGSQGGSQRQPQGQQSQQRRSYFGGSR